jgi:DNA-binding transcriptional LysR family regulator
VEGVLLRWAQRMRFDVEDAKREMESIGQGLSGQVRIGIVPTAAQFLLPAAARQRRQSRCAPWSDWSTR